MAEHELKPRVLIAADRPSLRAAIRLALDSSAVCAEADGAGAAVEAVAGERRDVCFLDAGNGVSGIRAAQLIRRLQPETKVVLMAHPLREEEFLQAVRAGVAGYLPDTLDLGRLPAILTAVLRGEAAVPRALVQRLLDEVREMGKRRIALDEHREVTLTRREAEVLDLLREGLPTDAIARRLEISRVTVRRHRSTLSAKLGIRANSDLRQVGVLPPASGSA